MVPYFNCLQRIAVLLHGKYGSVIDTHAAHQVYAVNRSVVAGLFPEFESDEWLEALVERMWEDGHVVKDDGQELCFSQAFALSVSRLEERGKWFGG